MEEAEIWIEMHQDGTDSMSEHLTRRAFEPDGAKGPRLASFEPDPLSGEVIGAAIEVHRVLGPGHLESAYENALAIEFEIRGIAFERQFALPLRYKGNDVGESRLDFLVESELIVELKAIEALAPVHTAQVIAYLKTTAKKRALLINFNVPVLKQGIKRISL